METHPVMIASINVEMGIRRDFLDMILVFEQYYKYIKPEQKTILTERYYIFTPVFVPGCSLSFHYLVGMGKYIDRVEKLKDH